MRRKKNQFLKEAQEILKKVFIIEEYITNKTKERKDFLNLEIDKFIETYYSLLQLKRFTTADKGIDKSLLEIKKILVDLSELQKTKKKESHSVMYINPDNKLNTFEIKGKHKNTKFSFHYTPRTDRFNNYIRDNYSLSKSDLNLLLFEILKLKTNYDESHIKEWIQPFVGSISKTKWDNEIHYAVISIPEATLNIPFSELSDNNYMRYNFYFKNNHDSKATKYARLTKEDIKEILSFNKKKYL